MNGFPGREDCIEKSDSGFANRSVVAGNRMIRRSRRLQRYSPRRSRNSERLSVLSLCWLARGEPNAVPLRPRPSSAGRGSIFFGPKKLVRLGARGRRIRVLGRLRC
jgi:hypothetical protein